MTADQMAEELAKEHRPTSLIQRFASVEKVANTVVRPFRGRSEIDGGNCK